MTQQHRGSCLNPTGNKGALCCQLASTSGIQVVISSVHPQSRSGDGTKPVSANEHPLSPYPFDMPRDSADDTGPWHASRFRCQLAPAVLSAPTHIQPTPPSVKPRGPVHPQFGILPPKLCPCPLSPPAVGNELFSPRNLFWFLDFSSLSQSSIPLALRQQHRPPTSFLPVNPFPRKIFNLNLQNGWRCLRSRC